MRGCSCRGTAGLLNVSGLASRRRFWWKGEENNQRMEAAMSMVHVQLVRARIPRRGECAPGGRAGNCVGRPEMM